ncbi:MAG: hypothetical protein KBF12_07675 [Sebaldella sp.]|nr:hypothetical protein [Sebaldella sp.]
MEVKEYRSSKVMIFINIIKIIFFSIIISSLITTIAGGVIFKIEDDSLLLNVGIIIFLIIFIFSIFNLMYFKNIKIRIYPEYISFFRRNKEYLRFEKNGYVFSSYVISHSTNGIPTGKERFLRVHDTNGEKRYKCYNFSKRNFDEMMSFIISDKSQIFEEMTNNTPQSHKFITPKEKVIGDVKKKIWILVLMFIVIIGIFMYVFRSLEFSLGSFFITVGVAAVMPLIGLFFILAKICDLQKNMPKIIELTNTYISLDDERINFRDVSKIQLTPASYSSNYSSYRKIKIFFYEGKKKQYILSIRSGKNMLLEYEEICDILHKNFINEPGKFQYDL